MNSKTTRALLHCPLHISMSQFPYWQHVLKYRLTLPEMSNIYMLSSSDRVVYGASRCITVPQTSHTPIKRNRIQRYDKDMSVLPLRKTFITDWHFVFFLNQQLHKSYKCHFMSLHHKLYEGKFESGSGLIHVGCVCGWVCLRIVSVVHMHMYAQ